MTKQSLFSSTLFLGGGKALTMTMTPSILAMVMVKDGQFWPFDHENFVILAMVMVKNGQFWPFDHGNF